MNAKYIMPLFKKIIKSFSIERINIATNDPIVGYFALTRA